MQQTLSPSRRRKILQCAWMLITALVVMPSLFLPQPLYAATGATPGAATTSSPQSEIVVQVPLPIMKTKNCTSHFNKKTKEPLTCVASYAEYVGLIYRYFSSIVGILAAVMLLWGGFRWMAAAGNESRVESAKETIYSAIIAVVIVLGSYVLLYTINPQLTKPNLYGVQPVGRIDQPYQACSNNAKGSIDLKNNACDPTTQNCCGKTFALKNQGEEKYSCIWDTCPNATDVCDVETGQCNPAGYACLFKANTSNVCTANDVKLQQQKQWNGKEQEFATKFVNTGCGFNGRTCQWDYFVRFSKTFPEWMKYIATEDFDPEPVDCFTTQAKEECWEYQDNKPVAKVCGNVKCADPAKQRAVASGSAVCLVKKGKRSNLAATTKDDYKCVPAWDRRMFPTSKQATPY